MLAVEDAIWALEWAKSIGGLAGLKARSDANAAALDKIVAERDWLHYLAKDRGIRSKTSVCLVVHLADEAIIKRMAALLEKRAQLTTLRVTATLPQACASGVVRP